MWRIESIDIENIISFKKASLTFEQGVATLIFGKNEDNASQPCNGSGKSSLIEAISFALTGEQLRKVKSVEEIINDHAEEAYVRLKLFNDYDNVTFVIERTISRNAAQHIECHKYDGDGSPVDKDNTIQPTVADYNKFILSEIGLTKDDIYNNYILCDNKYESFFDCSDRNKKEVINRFSNGVIIDESIERVQKDMEPVEAELAAANNNVIRVKGSISAIEAELEQADVKKADAKQQREKRISNLDDSIDAARDDIEKHKRDKRRGEIRLMDIQAAQKEVVALEDSGKSLNECYQRIVEICEKDGLGEITNFDELLASYEGKLVSQNKAIQSIREELAETKKIYEQQNKECVSASDAYQENCSHAKYLDEKALADKKKLDEEIRKIDKRIEAIDAEMKKCANLQKSLEGEVMRIEALLKGVITCPKCRHQFLLDREETVEQLNEGLQDAKLHIQQNESERQKLNDNVKNLDAEAAGKEDSIFVIEQEIKKRAKSLEEEYAELRKLSRRVADTETDIAGLNKDLINAQNELDRINGRIDTLRNRLFGEITGILEGRIANGKQYIEGEAAAITFAEGQMKQYQQSKKELLEAPETDFEASLQSSLKKYKDELQTAEQAAAEVQKRYDELRGQELHFTAFKSYIAKKKIDALSLIVNDFLEKIGSDIRLKLEGFTMTKTGKLRDKISVQVMRDGIDCGSYHKFSGGEKARLNLACILSLHTLTNSNCEDGKGLDFIIIDELLDKSDEVGMSTYCDAFNKLKQTALLITQGGISEGYPHKLLITKRQGVSIISK